SVLLGRFYRGSPGDLPREGLVDQCPVRHSVVRITGDDNETVTHLQRILRYAKTRGGTFEEDEAGLRPRRPDDGTGDLQAHAAGGVALVGRQLGVALNDRDSREGDIELLRRNLGERSHDPGAQLDFADVDRYRAALIDRKPGIDSVAGNI